MIDFSFYVFRALEKATSHDDLLKHLEQVSKELEEKSAHHDTQIADCLAATESNTLNISLNQKTMQEGFDDGKCQQSNSLNSLIFVLKGLYYQR